jgi:uncharacterized membrane protein YebE (DUF533 family)
MKNTLTLLAAAALSLVSLGAAAQHAPTLNQRQANQEARIDQGIASGELTRREVHRLEHQQNVINRYENNAQADGTVTAKERQRMAHALNHASRNIYRHKHDQHDRQDR